MKVLVFSESSADEAAIRILAEAILAEPIELPAGQSFRQPRNGWSHVLSILPAIIRHAYFRTDADGLIVVVDSDDSPFHRPDHDPSHEQACRWCQFRRAADDTLWHLKPRPVQNPLRIAIGLAPNAIEAWLLYPRDPHYCEAAWIRGQANRQPPFSRPQLKRAMYGTVSPSLAIETRAMVQAATDIAAKLPEFEQAFPVGFGLMAAEIRSWRT